MKVFGVDVAPWGSKSNGTSKEMRRFLRESVS